MTPRRASGASLLALLALLAAAPLGAPLGAQTNDAYPRPAGTHPVAVERSVMVPMRDGARLATDVYRPADVTGPLPAIVMRTPYNKAGSAGAGNFFASHGYAVVVQDVRGKFGSEGEFRVYQGDRSDWSDAFDWVGAQPWSDKRVGTFGCSYLGEVQILLAATRHPAHLAAVPQAAAAPRPRKGRAPNRLRARRCSYLVKEVGRSVALL